MNRDEYRQRKEDRVERLRAAADRHRDAAAAAHAGVSRIADAIPLGQPILVGHHSERHARRDQDRIYRGMQRAVVEDRTADDLERRASAAERNTAISSDDPDAEAALREKLARLERLRADMSRLNREWRRGGAAALTGVTEEQRARIAAAVEGRESWQDARPFERYQLANLGGKIRQVRERLETLAARAAVPSSTETIGAVEVRDDADANRVQVVFPGRPAATTIAALRRAGFRWAPSLGLWQRQRSAGALEVAKGIARADQREVAP